MKAEKYLLEKLNWYKNLEVDLEEILKEEPNFLESKHNLEELRRAIVMAENELEELQ